MAGEEDSLLPMHSIERLQWREMLGENSKRIEYPIINKEYPSDEVKERSEATSFLGHWTFRVGYWVFRKKMKKIGLVQTRKHASTGCYPREASEPCRKMSYFRTFFLTQACVRWYSKHLAGTGLLFMDFGLPASRRVRGSWQSPERSA